MRCPSETFADVGLASAPSHQRATGRQHRACTTPAWGTFFAPRRAGSLQREGTDLPSPDRMQGIAVPGCMRNATVPGQSFHSERIAGIATPPVRQNARQGRASGAGPSPCTRASRYPPRASSPAAFLGWLARCIPNWYQKGRRGQTEDLVKRVPCARVPPT